MEQNKKRFKAKQSHYDETLPAAIEAVTSGELSLRKASVKFGVPVATLFRRVRGKGNPQSEQLGPESVSILEELQSLGGAQSQVSKCASVRAGGNFNRHDTDTLIDLYAAHFKTLQLPFAKLLSCAERAQNWREMTRQFNKLSKVPRICKQLQHKIASSMSEIRKFESALAKYQSGSTRLVPKPLTKSLENLSIFKNMIDEARRKKSAGKSLQEYCFDDSLDIVFNVDGAKQELEVGEYSACSSQSLQSCYQNETCNYDGTAMNSDGRAPVKKKARKRASAEIFSAESDGGESESTSTKKPHPTKGTYAGLERERFKAVLLEQEYYKLKIDRLKREKTDYETEIDLKRQESSCRSETLILERESIVLKRNRIQLEMHKL